MLTANRLEAQTNAFDLSKYKTADYSRRSLIFSGNISGSYAESESETSFNNYRKNFNSNLELDFNSIKNTRKKQNDLNINFALNPVKYNYNSVITNSEADNYYFYYDRSENIDVNEELYFNSSNRSYFSGKKYFEFGANGYLLSGYNKQDRKNTNSGTSTSGSETLRQLQSELKIPLRIGTGRLENVEDARMAIFILEDLQKNQQLSKTVADEDILMFAEKITKLRNMRHFDTRKKRIYEIQSLDSFLTENNFSSAQNAVYFSSIIDNWEFANNFTRASGTRVSLGVTPNLSYINENYLSNLKSVNFNKGVEISANLLSEAPLSLKWQRRAGLSTGYLKSWDNEKYTHPVWEDSKREGDNDIVYLSGNYGYGFYPDSRSYHQLSIGADASKNWYKWDEPSAGDTKWYWRYNVSLYFSGYFYFTEKLNLTYGFNVGYEERNTKNGTNKAKINNFATSFNVSLLYSIF